MPNWRIVRGANVVDPYFEWANRTNFAYYSPDGPPEFVPVIMELGMAAAAFAQGEWRAPPDRRDLIRVPPVYARPPDELAGASFCTAWVRPAFFGRLFADAGMRAAIRRVELSLPVETEFPVGAPPPGPVMLRDRRVMIGIIDDGIAFAHDRFRRGGGTRFEYFWNQDGPPTPTPPWFGYGLELEKALPVTGMDARMAQCTHAGIVDEDQVYRLTRHLRYGITSHKPLAARAAHGTHVADVACGQPPATANNLRPIIGVQLPVAMTADTSGGSLAGYALDGLRYILNRAQNIPLVVNLSYGLVAGPHNGGSILEQGIEQLIALRNQARSPFSVVLPAGNSFLSRIHARVRLPAPPPRSRLTWCVQPDDKTPSFMEIWPQGPGPCPASVRVTTPTGIQSPWINPGEVWVWIAGGAVLAEVVYFDLPGPGRDRPMIFIALAPTASDDAAPTAPAGEWIVQLRANSATVLRAWIQRDDTPFGYPQRGRQSYFVDPRYERRDESGRDLELDQPGSLVRRYGTLNALATGGRPVVVGAYRRKERQLSNYSAGGPVIRPARGAPWQDGPDVVAAGDDSAIHRGLAAAGTRSSSVILMSGTSVAAPQVTRLIADRMAQGLPCDRASIAALGVPLLPPPPPGPLMDMRAGGGAIVVPPIVNRLLEP